MRIAIYAGSFDPPTRGHLDILQGAVKTFDRVIVGVGVNSNKKGLLWPSLRIDLMGQIIDEQFVGSGAKPTVRSFEGLLIDFCRQILNTPLVPDDPTTVPDTVSIVRGLRAVSDFESEMAIADANRRLDSRFQTVFIPTKAEMAFVSSSIVRELLSHDASEEQLQPYLTPSTVKFMKDFLRASWNRGD